MKGYYAIKRWICLSAIFFVFTGCDNDKPKLHINENIMRIKGATDDYFITGDFLMGVWSGDSTLYYCWPARKARINSFFEVSQDSQIPNVSLSINAGGAPNYMALRSDNSKLLVVGTFYTDVSIGSLQELDLTTYEVTQVVDSSRHVSSAVYLNNGTSCIYYSYGFPGIGTAAGYYYHDILSGVDSLIFPFFSE